MALKIDASKLNKALRRERKHQKKVHGMRVDGSSVKDIQRIQQERAERIRLGRLQKEELERE